MITEIERNFIEQQLKMNEPRQVSLNLMITRRAITINDMYRTLSLDDMREWYRELDRAWSAIHMEMTQ